MLKSPTSIFIFYILTVESIWLPTEYNLWFFISPSDTKGKTVLFLFDIQFCYAFEYNILVIVIFLMLKRQRCFPINHNIVDLIR